MLRKPVVKNCLYLYLYYAKMYLTFNMQYGTMVSVYLSGDSLLIIVRVTLLQVVWIITVGNVGLQRPYSRLAFWFWRLFLFVFFAVCLRWVCVLSYTIGRSVVCCAFVLALGV